MEHTPLFNFFAKRGGGKSNYVHREIGKFFLTYLSEFEAKDFLQEGWSFLIKEFTAGPGLDFDVKEGPRNVRKLPRGMISIEFDIPMSAWQGNTQEEFKFYYADGIESCFSLLVEKANKLGLVKDEEGLRGVIEASVAELRGHDFGDWFWGARVAE